MAEREQTYWWHVGRLAIIDEMLGKLFPDKDARILNVGCGTGGTIDVIEKYSREVVNIDVSDEAIKFMKKAGYIARKVGTGKLPFKAEEFDAVVAFDVLEHIEDEDLALSEWNRILKKDGIVFITVPAYKWLWSGHDESLFHFRRYTATRLRTLVKNHRFNVVKCAYMIVFSTPLVAGFRLLHKIRKSKDVTEETSYVQLPSVVNQSFIGLLKVESKAQRYINFPFGTSVIGIFRKR